MENNSIINFNDFFKDENSKKLEFNKENFNDFFIEDDSEKSEEYNHITESNKSEEITKISDTSVKEEFEKMDNLELSNNDNKYHIESNESYYLVYKDKSEDFSCDIQLEGANLNDTKARLILESNDWTLLFEGEIDKNGKCNIPIRKLGILNEGTVGRIKLEVIAEGTVFVPWEDEFKVKVSKKVSVVVNENKRQSSDSKKSGVKVNFKK